MRDDGAIGSPNSKQPYFRPTTADQRRLVFAVYEQTEGPRQARAAGEKGGPVVRHADEPDQGVNADLCFVPATHAQTEPVPAISGSSGRLVVSRVKRSAEERVWPGWIFEREALSYPESMEQFIVARRTKEAKGPKDPVGGQATADRKAQ